MTCHFHLVLYHNYFLFGTRFLNFLPNFTPDHHGAFNEACVVGNLRVNTVLYSFGMVGVYDRRERNWASWRLAGK